MIFGKDLKDADCVLVYREEQGHIVTFDCYGREWDEYLASYVPEIEAGEDEFVLDHNYMVGAEPFLSEFLEYISDGSREVRFGPFNTKTLVVHLRKGWRDLCLTEDEAFSAM